MIPNVPTSRDEARSVMDKLLEGALTHAEVVSYLRKRPIHDARPDELLGYRDSIWARRRQAAFPQATLDVCGTGGVRQPRFNVSTTVAFITGALGVATAKHGNRGSVRQNGSFDFLELLGLPVDVLTTSASDTLKDPGLAFLFARDWHPCMAALAQARREVGEPTVFNLLGPLLNPATPTHQLVGCRYPEAAEALAQTFCALGINALVVSGADELDEITVTGPTRLWHVRPHSVQQETLTLDQLGLSPFLPDEMHGGDAQENAGEFSLLLAGKGNPGVRLMVLLNAAYALYIADVAESPSAAYQTVADALDGGLVQEFYERFRRRVRSEMAIRE